MHALQHSGGAAVGCLLNRQVHLLTDSYAFVVHKFKPKDQYRRRLDNKALELAIEPNGVKGRISKVWKTYSMWIAQLENPIDARKVGKIGKIILDGALWTVT
jgi:hypothetical protein